jgi:plastocyanin
MKKFALTLAPLALVLALGLAACGHPAADNGPGSNTGGGGGGGNCITAQTVDMSQTDFVQHCVNATVNTAFTFNDPTTTGNVHIICTGQNGSCQTNSDAPSDLAAPGFTIQPGQTKQVTFTKAGTYHIACTVHPAMNLTINVQ